MRWQAQPDGTVRDFPASALAGIIAPGGWAPDKIRRDQEVLERVRQVHAAGKLVGTDPVTDIALSAHIPTIG